MHEHDEQLLQHSVDIARSIVDRLVFVADKLGQVSAALVSEDGNDRSRVLAALVECIARAQMADDTAREWLTIVEPHRAADRQARHAVVVLCAAMQQVRAVCKPAVHGIAATHAMVEEADLSLDPECDEIAAHVDQRARAARLLARAVRHRAAEAIRVVEGRGNG